VTPFAESDERHEAAIPDTVVNRFRIKEMPVVRLINSAAFALLVLFVVIVPIAYGDVLPGGTLLIEAFGFGMALLAFATRRAGRRLGMAVLPLLAMLAIAALGIAQLLPLPIDTLRRIAPLSARVYVSTNGVLRRFNHPAVPARISVAPAETASTTLLTLAYAAIFAAASILSDTRRRRRILLAAVFATSSIHVFYAALAPPDAREGEMVTRLHGAFVNPNHLAGYLEIGLACAFGMIWQEIQQSRRRAAGVRDKGDQFEKRIVPITLRILLWGLLAAGIALTRSRGGILAAAVTTLALVTFVATATRAAESQRARFAASIAIAIVAGLAFVTITTGNAPLLRFMASDPRDVRNDTRTLIWSASVNAWRTSPAFGDGLGAFRESFRRVQPANVAGLVEQAHNDFLQMLVTGGVIGALLVVVAQGSILVLLMRALMKQQHREERALALAGVGAILSLTLHGVVEFNMSIPAIPATLAAVLGAAWTAAHSESGDSTPSPNRRSSNGRTRTTMRSRNG
jgi:O-antigen ligase